MSLDIKDITPVKAREYGSPPGTGYMTDAHGNVKVSSVKDLDFLIAVEHAFNAYPDLVEAVQLALDISNDLPPNVRDLLRDALAKAKGKQS